MRGCARNYDIVLNTWGGRHGHTGLQHVAFVPDPRELACAVQSLRQHTYPFWHWQSCGSASARKEFGARSEAAPTI